MKTIFAGIKRYAAWAKMKGSEGPYTTTIVYAENMKQAKEKFKKFDLNSKVYLSNVKN